jgi:hypothetical protein
MDCPLFDCSLRIWVDNIIEDLAFSSDSPDYVHSFSIAIAKPGVHKISIDFARWYALASLAWPADRGEERQRFTACRAGSPYWPTTSTTTPGPRSIPSALLACVLAEPLPASLVQLAPWLRWTGSVPSPLATRCLCSSPLLDIYVGASAAGLRARPVRLARYLMEQPAKAVPPTGSRWDRALPSAFRAALEPPPTVCPEARIFD